MIKSLGERQRFWAWRMVNLCGGCGQVEMPGHQSLCPPCARKANEKIVLRRGCEGCGTKTQGIMCMKCRRALQAENRAKRLSRAELSVKVAELKSAPCMDCKRCFPSVAMDFDHRNRKAKTASVSSMVSRHLDWDAIQAEIAKCDLVCSNCHRVRSFGAGLEKKI